MELWFAGTYGDTHHFQIYKDGKKPQPYTLRVDRQLVEVEDVFYRDAIDPMRSTQCFKAKDKGLFLFPWNWGDNNLTWPRRETLAGEIQLIRLAMDRGQVTNWTPEHEARIKVITELTAKNPRREFYPRGVFTR